MMLSLGLFVFMLKTVPYQELQQQKAWRHATNSRIGRRPSSQFLGPDTDVITLTGTLFPALTGGRFSMLTLEQMADTGKAWSLLDGAGTIYGMYVIESINQTKKVFFSDGSARQIDFTISLKRVDESLTDMFGDLADQLGQMKDNVSSAIGGMLS
ncbi:phage tail protein [Plesiomonas shigelloides]|uniref:phage tail protein n=1 Tax=Plesiomonas shigelloides TaxID=703 RepID=UPI00057AF080|nr:phage tail protein [Plesiomonas shigelloides]